MWTVRGPTSKQSDSEGPSLQMENVRESAAQTRGGNHVIGNVNGEGRTTEESTVQRNCWVFYVIWILQVYGTKRKIVVILLMEQAVMFTSGLKEIAEPKSTQICQLHFNVSPFNFIFHFIFSFIYLFVCLVIPFFFVYLIMGFYHDFL